MRMIPKSLFQTKGWINGKMPSNLSNKLAKFGTVVPVKDSQEDEMDDSTCNDIVSDSTAEYERNRYEAQTGDRSSNWGGY